MAHGIDLGQVWIKTLTGGLNGNLGHVKFTHQRCSVTDDQPHRFDHAPTAVTSFNLSRDQQALIAVVMKDSAVVLQIRLRESLGYTLHYEITNGVRVTEPFAFDDLDIEFSRSGTAAFLNANRVHIFFSHCCLNRLPSG